jgi:putative restriction endonuclease
MQLDLDWQIRLAAMRRMEQLRAAGDGVVRAADLDEGFVFNGDRIALWSSQRGIWRPQQLRAPGAALTVVTAPRVQGRKPAYDDEVAADDRGWFGYKYEGTNPETWTNVAVRRAMELQRPIIYLYGITKGTYEAIFPVFVTGDDPASLTFRLQADQAKLDPVIDSEYAKLSAPRREYRTVAVKQRLHQHRFRELVLGAYRRRCAMCNIGHSLLLDAAHIIPDRDDRGLPEVPNGLALCKIHHSAYDINILGISPDLLIHVREDILAERDGPMLEHGIKGMDGRRISVPRPEDLRPNREFLEERFELFKAA